eukprot:m51a1_g6254 putative cysteine proteinase rd21a-like (329) ;mRNA; f:95382-96657
MHRPLLLCCLLLLALASPALSAASAAASGDDGDDWGSWEYFQLWARQHRRAYTAAEAKHRWSVFRANAALARALNAGRTGPSAARFGPTRFSDLTNDEFASTATSSDGADDVSNTTDLRYMLPPPVDQGQCGASWAFAAVAGLEALAFHRSNATVKLSEQQVISCDAYMNEGCAKGELEYSVKYVLENGLEEASSYPYASGDGTRPPCKPQLRPALYARQSTRWERAQNSDGRVVERLLQWGPLMVSIAADRPMFQGYRGGILDTDSCGVVPSAYGVLVGYGSEDGVKYWNVRLSWGSGWGEGGHVRLVRGKNMCGINTDLFAFAGLR